jgi:hypothetical protein
VNFLEFFFTIRVQHFGITHGELPMSSAAINPGSPQPASATPAELLRPRDTLSTKFVGSGNHESGLVDKACAEIVARWRRAGLSEDAALEQALRFAVRFSRARAGVAFVPQPNDEARS